VRQYPEKHGSLLKVLMQADPIIRHVDRLVHHSVPLELDIPNCRMDHAARIGAEVGQAIDRHNRTLRTPEEIVVADRGGPTDVSGFGSPQIFMDHTGRDRTASGDLTLIKV
jgi:hypothetical protein